MRAVSDSELAARIRRQNRDGSQRRRDKQAQQGKVQLGGLWVPTSTKQRLETLAKDAELPLSAVVAAAIDRVDPADILTHYLLSSPANAARLMTAIADHQAGKKMEAQELLPDDDG